MMLNVWYDSVRTQRFYWLYLANILKVMFSPTRLGSPIALLIPPYLRLISSDMTAALFLAELVRIVSGILLSVESCFWLVREFTILHFVNLSYSRSSAIGFTDDLSSIQIIRIYSYLLQYGGRGSVMYDFQVFLQV